MASVYDKPSNSIASNSYATDLIASYLLNEGSGTIVYDDSVYAASGTITGMTHITSPGSGIHSLGGSGGCVLGLDGFNTMSTAGTLLLWAITSDTEEYQGMLCLNNNTTGDNQAFEIQAHIGTSRIVCKPNGAIFDGTYDYVDGALHQIVVTRDGTTVRLYVDGEKRVDDYTLLSSPNWSGVWSYAGIGNWGTSPYSCAADYFLAQAWKRALSATEISELYNDPYLMYAGGTIRYKYTYNGKIRKYNNSTYVL